MTFGRTVFSGKLGRTGYPEVSNIGSLKSHESRKSGERYIDLFTILKAPKTHAAHLVTVSLEADCANVVCSTLVRLLCTLSSEKSKYLQALNSMINADD